MEASITISFTYDTTRGVYTGSVNGGQRFYFSGHRDAPLPGAMANALEALRKLTMLEAQPAFKRTKSEVLPLDAVLDKVREFEAKGGRVQTVGPRPKLTLEDLDI